MELDITHMIESADEMIELSGSQMEHGRDAGRITWNNSVEFGKEHPLLSSDDARDQARRYFREFGAWTEEEIAAWTEDELQAIVCQDVAHAIREMEVAEGDYEQYRLLSEQGTCSGKIYKGDDGRWYFYMC